MKLSSEYHVKKTTRHGKGFTDLNTLLYKIGNIADNMKDDVKQMAASDAAVVAEQLAKNYDNYMTTYGPIGETREGASLEQTNVKLKKGRNGLWQGAPEITINETKNGFTVKMSGKDILYQEYGTGTVGEGEYLGKLPSYWDYASGPTIISNYEYINSGSLYGEIPGWYKNAVRDGKISKSAKVWMSPRGITEGNHAGNFMYNTFNEIIDQLDSEDSRLQCGRKNLNIYIRNKISGG